MNSADFLALAIRLSNSRNEAELRTSVSRSYYGAFHCVVELIEKCGVKLPEAAEAHEKIRWCLDQASHPDAKLASDKLNSLRADRNEADYDLRSVRFQNSLNAQLLLRVAQDIANAIANCAAEPVYSDIRARIRKYARETLRFTVSDDDPE